MNGTDYQITEAMLTYGGNFAKKLAEAFRAADSVNQFRLKSEFADLWTEYLQMAKLAEKRAQMAASPQGDGDPGDCDSTGISHE